MPAKKVDRRFGGMDRAKVARAAIFDITCEGSSDPMYFFKDIDLAKKYGVSRHTIYKIREELNIPNRAFRILNCLTKMDLKKYTLKEVSNSLKIKYQNLYKIVKDFDLEVKKDED